MQPAPSLRGSGNSLPGANGLNVQLYPTSAAYQSRWLRAAQAAYNSGHFDESWLLGISIDGTTSIKEFPQGRRIVELPLTVPECRRMRWFRLLEWTVRSVASIARRNVRCVTAHSISSLPAAAIIKLIKRCKLVYDAHELETESSLSKGVRRIVARCIEAFLIRFADAVIVVSEGIADWYRRTYPERTVSVIRNIPAESVPAGGVVVDQPIRRRLGLPETAMIFLYSGQLCAGRSIELLLEVFARLPQDRHLVFVGYGEYEGRVKDCALKSPNIHLLSPVASEDVVSLTATADVALSMIENVCLSYYYSLPNKFLQALAAGVPVLASQLPEMERVVRTYNCGWCIPPRKDALEDLLNHITWPDIHTKSVNARAWARQNSWGNEENKLRRIYNTLFGATLDGAP